MKAAVWGALRPLLPRALTAVFFLLAVAASASPSPRKDADHVKAALISKCLQYVAWPDDAKPTEIRIGLLGVSESGMEAFAEMARNVSISGKPVRIVRLSGPNDFKGSNVLFADAAYADLGQQLWKGVEKKRIFLVTERFPDKKYVMLNLILDAENSRMTFEINRANAMLEGFTIKPELLLLGGSEIDVRELYRKMRDDLIAQDENVRKKQLKLEVLGAKVDSMRRKMDQYATSLVDLENSMRQSAAKLAGQEDRQKKLSGEINLKGEELARQIKKLEGQKAEIEEKQTGIARLRGEIAGLSTVLTEKERTIAEGRTVIGAQEAELRRQGERIAEQRYLIILSVIVSLFLFALGGVIFTAYRFKRAAAANLEENVRKRTEELESAFRKQRELEANLQQSEKLKSIGQLAGGIAHDFNNQLGGILGFADLLREKLADRPLLRDFADTIITLVGRSKDLTSQLLAFARKGQYQSVAVDLRELIAEVLSLLERTVDKTISVRGAPGTAPAYAMGDPSQLQNAILNLAINARDAMPQGGEILISTSVEEVPAARDGSGAGGGTFARISVKDNGIGMNREILKHIFEPFFTTKEMASGQPGGRMGTGMGLAAVLGTIQAHKGFVEVDSEPGLGSEFRLYLPWIPEPVPTGMVREIPAPQPGEKAIHILMVDDEDFMRDLSLSIFQSMGHTIEVCKDGAEALHVYREGWRGFDLVILDMVMPGMNGKELFAKLKAINPGILAILASGYSSDADARDLLASGVRAIISKPYGKAEMAHMIQDLFARPPEKADTVA